MNTSIIPRYKADPILRRTFRFEATAAFNGLIYAGNLALMWAGGADGSGAGQALTPVISNARLTKVKVWHSNNGSMSIGNASVQWTSQNAPDNEISASGNAFNFGKFSCVPPRRSLAGYWNPITINTSAMTSETTSLFTLNVPQGAIIDIDLEFVCSSGVLANFITTSGNASNQIYFADLDGSWNFSTHAYVQGVLAPVSNSRLAA